MKILLSFIGSFFIVFGVSAEWDKPQKIDDDFNPECYETVHEVSIDNLEA